MVKKLFKYELKHYLGTVLLLEFVVMLVAFFTRIITLFESDTVMYTIISVSSVVFLAIAILASFIITEILIVVRFYKNLFSSEGYLSFTLPVTESQHIFVKLTSAILMNITVLCGALVAVFVASFGELGVEIFKAAIYLIKHYFVSGSSGVLGVISVIGFVVEAILFMLVSQCFAYLLYYSCMTIGQLAKKNRVLASIGVYFVYTFVMQTISTIIAIVVSIFALSEYAYSIEVFWEENTEPLRHIISVFAILIVTALAFGLFSLIRRILSRKLNLE